MSFFYPTFLFFHGFAISSFFTFVVSIFGVIEMSFLGLFFSYF